MHRVQIGNSLVGSGAGARAGRGLGPPWGSRDTGGVPQTVHRKRRRRREGKTFRRAPGKRAAQDGAEPSLQVSATSPRRWEEVGVGRKGSRS